MVVAVSCLVPQASRAVIIDLHVTGVTLNVTPAVSSVFSPGDTFSAVYSYDSDAVAGGSLILTQAVYLGAISGADFSIGASYAGSAVGGNINIENDDPTFHDRVIFRAAGLSSASIGTHIPVELTVLFDDPSEAALSDLSLPTSTSDLAGFVDPLWQLLFSPLPLSGAPVAAVDGVITSFTISVHPDEAPEPATRAILGLGLAGLGLMRRKRAA